MAQLIKPPRRAHAEVATLVAGISLIASCSTGTGTGSDRFKKSPDNQPTNTKVPPIELDAASETQDLCNDPASVSKPYRGVNLTGLTMAAYGQVNGYAESDFSLLHDLGFNWARLPIDYLNYTEEGDWLRYSAAGLSKIDQAVAYGCQYAIHVCLNLYEAPGYSVATNIDPSGLSLWKDAAAQQAFATHWQMFARRYANVPADNLSFNLVNEPPGPQTNSGVTTFDESVYLGVMRQAIKAIREVSPNRPILLDGLNFGRIPLKTLNDTSIIQAVHDYDPIQVTHYKAPWVDGSTNWPQPQWPPFMASQYLFGPLHSDVSGSGPGKDYCQLTSEGFCSPLTFQGSFPAGTTITLTIAQASYADGSAANTWSSTRLVAYTNSPTSPILEQDFSVANFPADEPPCSNACANATYHVLQPEFDRDFSFQLGADAAQFSVQVISGDWVKLSQITLTFPTNSGLGSVRLVPAIQRWDVPQAAYTLDASGHAQLSGSPPAGYERDYNAVGWFQDWADLKQSGYQVMVGEFGVYNQTPQDVTLAWFKDQLDAFKGSGFNGWATWDPYAEFGIMGPPRPGEVPENYASHTLNRPMLQLLMQY